MLAHWMKTVGEPESDWLLCWVLSLSQSDAGFPTRSTVTPLQGHPTSHTTSSASQFFYSNLSYHGSTSGVTCETQYRVVHLAEDNLLLTLNKELHFSIRVHIVAEQTVVRGQMGHPVSTPDDNINFDSQPHQQPRPRICMMQRR